jgi:hypothetical protein
VSRILELEGNRPQLEIESPEANYTRGIKAAQGVVHHQGQVMSAALANNQNLYHSNKRLRTELERVLHELLQLKVVAERQKHQLDAVDLAGSLDKTALLAENAALKAANALMQRELTLSHYSEIGEDDRKAILEGLGAQARELDLSGWKPTFEQIHGATKQEVDVQRAGLDLHEKHRDAAALERAAIEAAPVSAGVPDEMPPTERA